MESLELLNTAATAARLGVDVRTVARWVKAGRIVPTYKGPGATGAYVFTRDEVERFAATYETSDGAA